MAKRNTDNNCTRGIHIPSRKALVAVGNPRYIYIKN